MENRKEKYLLALQGASMDKKIRVIKAMQAHGYLPSKFYGVGETIEEIQRVLDEVHPNSWDILVNKNYENPFKKEGWKKETPFTLEFVIHYPEILITNRDNKKHLIRDLYIKLIPTFSSTGLSFNNFKGKRMTASKREIVSSYQHSHLPGREYTWDIENEDSNFNYRGFCLGESEIKQALIMLSSSFSENKFKLFLLQLEEYLNYESIEGTPYKNIENTIGGGKVKKLSLSGRRDYYFSLTEKRKEPGRAKEIDFKLDKNKIVVVDNEKFEEFLKIHSSTAFYDNTFLCEKDEIGEYYGYRNMPKTLPDYLILKEEDYEEVEFVFRGETVKFKIVEEQESQNKPFYINKYIKEYVKTRIEQGIEEKRFRSYIIKQLNTPTYLSRNTRQDTVPLSENK